jgi:phosphatidylglycerophosphatase A
MPESVATPFTTRVALNLATAGGLGLLRPGPGTWGSLGAGCAAYVLTFVVAPAWWLTVMLLLVAACLMLAFLSVPRAVAHFQVLDPKQVVIDEVAGVWLAVALIPSSIIAHAPLSAVVLAVLFFRVFDIAKPWPVSWFERIPGTLGIMADDLVAGIIAACLAIACLR